jgi:phospholipid/cholesterol/gamma-HCH transport system substrate-binding protein
MSDQQLAFRVGLFVLVSTGLAAGLLFRFGELDFLWEKEYEVAVFFTSAPGVAPGIPVRKAGVRIGRIDKIFFDDERGGVTAVARINQKFPLRKDSQPRLVRGLLGDATLEFSAGAAREMMRPGTKLDGVSAADPMEIVARMEQQVAETLDAFQATSGEWQKVGRNVNALVETNRGNLDVVVARAAESLHQFTTAMNSVNRIVADPENEKNLKQTLASLPRMVEDTRATIAAVRNAVSAVDENLTNLKNVTGPLAQKSGSVVTRLDNSLGHLEMLLAELHSFAKETTKSEGTLALFAQDPALYRNLNASAVALEQILKNLDPAIRDLRIFSDKVARHPEMIGVGGALKGSSGLK